MFPWTVKTQISTLGSPDRCKRNSIRSEINTTTHLQTKRFIRSRRQCNLTRDLIYNLSDRILTETTQLDHRLINKQLSQGQLNYFVTRFQSKPSTNRQTEYP